MFGAYKSLVGILKYAGEFRQKFVKMQSDYSYRELGEPFVSKDIHTHENLDKKRKLK